MTSKAQVDGPPAATPRPAGRRRRKPASGAERTRRDAWGETWGAVGKQAGELVRAAKGT